MLKIQHNPNHFFANKITNHFVVILYGDLMKDDQAEKSANPNTALPLRKFAHISIKQRVERNGNDCRTKDKETWLKDD